MIENLAQFQAAGGQTRTGAILAACSGDHGRPGARARSLRGERAGCPVTATVARRSWPRQIRRTRTCSGGSSIRVCSAGGLSPITRCFARGAVHRANGGYLLLPAAEVLGQPLVWLKLKEVLRSGQMRLENLAEQYAPFPTATLTPEPIELDLKVVLVGSPLLYELAYGPRRGCAQAVSGQGGIRLARRLGRRGGSGLRLVPELAGAQRGAPAFRPLGRSRA